MYRPDNHLTVRKLVRVSQQAVATSLIKLSGGRGGDLSMDRRLDRQDTGGPTGNGGLLSKTSRAPTKHTGRTLLCTWMTSNVRAGLARALQTAPLEPPRLARGEQKLRPEYFIFI